MPVSPARQVAYEILRRVDAGHGFDEVYLDASNAINCFPKAAIVGDDFTWTSVRDALTALVDNLKVRIGAEGNVWWVSRP